jgi:hypothetical protein
MGGGFRKIPIAQVRDEVGKPGLRCLINQRCLCYPSELTLLGGEHTHLAAHVLHAV